MRLRLQIAAVVLALLAAGAAQAADPPQDAVLVYQTDFFANARPNTAYDMIGRLPGFVFDDGDTARGFAGTAGNVLIDGQRPTSKTDDLQSILNRIPASDVDRIEVIRGGAPGIDMQGHTVIANVIRKKGDSTQIVADVEDQIFLGDWHTVPYLNLQYTNHSGDSTYEASIARLGNFDDSVGNGFHDVTDVGTGVVSHARAHSTGMGTGGQLTAAATVPLFGGQFKANLALLDDPFHDSVGYSAPGFAQRFGDKAGDSKAELGLHWNGDVGGVHLETLFLQRLGHQTDVNTSDAVLDHERFQLSADTGESIGRITLRYLPISTLTLESGAEGAYNFLNGASSFLDNGVPVPLPGANAKVNERRAEVFTQGTWKISDQWMLEAGARFEFSTISETGDVDLKRAFFYPKPRAVLTWTPDKETQIRFRYERVLGQLDFNNFIATSNLAATGVSAGNSNLKPDQHTQLELSAERHFWEKGALVVTLLHERIFDTVDFVPVTGPSGIFDAPGNIGTATNNQIDVELTVPLDGIGLTNGLLKTTSIWRMSKVPDPLTGQERVISGERPQDIEVTLTQDIDSLKSTWGIFYYNCWDEHYFRLTQVRHRSTVPPYLSMWWQYKPTAQWSLRLELENIGGFGYDDKFYDYPGPRNATPLESIEELSIKSQPRIYFQIRKTFD